MKLERIVTSLLENDLYKFSMGQAIYHQFSDYKTTWSFKCRNKDVRFTEEMVNEIREQIKAYCELRFTEDELKYLDGIKWIKGSYVDFLRLWKPRFEDFTITGDADCGLSIETAGTWLNTSMYEIPALAIVNEVYFRMQYDYEALLDGFKKKLDDKYTQLGNGHWYIGTFSEFGLRRRLSAEAQELVVEKFSHLNDTAHCASRFIGTSNVFLAKKYGVTSVGTMAHEWIMCVGQGNHKHNPAYSNWYALNAWVKEYGVLNGTALTDTITTDCFLEDFQLTFATLFSGVRHDSGDPIEWGEKMISHYEKLGIDAKEKTLLFSDSLDFERADKICRHFNGRAKVAFGIGTYLSNDTSLRTIRVDEYLKPYGNSVIKVKGAPELCEHLGIDTCVIDIGNTVEDMLSLIYMRSGIKISNQTEINIPARVRMTILYAISQSIDGRVANTCNLSENYVGYSTKYGDAAGDFSPLEDLTKTEVKAIGKELGLPERLVNKVPTDGLCGKTDEENFGFSYDMLDEYIRTGKIDDLPKQRSIECLHMMNEFKMKPMAHFEYMEEN